MLTTVAANPGVTSHWQAVVDFAFNMPHCPARGGKRQNLSSTILEWISGDSLADKLPQPTSSGKRVDTESLRAAAVTAKIEEGNVTAAVRILCSEDSPADYSQFVFAELQAKHPQQSSGPRLHPPPDHFIAYQATESEVLRAIRSFPAGSAAGTDGFRPQHLLELVLTRDAGPSLLTACTSFINMILDGSCHRDFVHIFFGGRLIAISKKGGGIRPIVIGNTLRRLASKCASSFASEKLKAYFAPKQMGVAVSGGCEAAVHATRRYLAELPQDHVVVKLDFTNAFNCLDRSHMLQRVAEEVPEIYKFCHLAYDRPSTLQFGDYTILSQVGAQQGDPLGGLLFCLEIHPLLESTVSDLSIGYMDDVTLGGSLAQVSSDVDLFNNEGRKIGLFLNSKKCEIITRHASSEATKLFVKVEPEAASLLGAPINTAIALDDAIESRVLDLGRAIQRHCTLPSHDALILLRSSFCAPRLMHLLRCSPCHTHPGLLAFDNLLKEGVSSITNSRLSDSQWTQASLPIRDGGLGIRRASSLALSAFLASAAGTANLQALILGSFIHSPDAAFKSACTQWSGIHKLAPLSGTSAASQRLWDAPGIATDKFNVTCAATTPLDKARLLALSASHSSDWLLALPISSCGLRLDNEAIRVAVGLRLGLPLCEAHICPCGATVDTRGVHGLSCRRSAGRAARHQQVNDLVYRALRRADVPAIKEPAGLARSDGKRPDGLTLIPWQGGRCLTWDVTIVDTCAASYVDANASAAGAAAEAAAIRKTAKYGTVALNHIFIPLAIETLGPLGSEALSFFADLGRRLSLSSDDPRETCYLFQRLSMLVQRYNAVAFRGSFVEDNARED